MERRANLLESTQNHTLLQRTLSLVCGVASNLSAKVEGPLYIHKCKLDCLKHCGPRNTIKIPCLAGSHKIPPINAPNLDKSDRKTKTWVS